MGTGPAIAPAGTIDRQLSICLMKLKRRSKYVWNVEAGKGQGKQKNKSVPFLFFLYQGCMHNEDYP